MNYREEAMRTFKSSGDIHEDLLLAIVGMSGESGEIIDWIKKYKFHNKKPVFSSLVLELGDLGWYIELFLHVSGIELKEYATKEYESELPINAVLAAALEMRLLIGYFEAMAYKDLLYMPFSPQEINQMTYNLSHIVNAIKYIADWTGCSMEDVQKNKHY